MLRKDNIINSLINKDNSYFNIFANYKDQISTTDIKEAFDMIIAVREKIVAILGFQYMLHLKSPIKDNVDIQFNSHIIILTIFQYFIDLLDKIIRSLIFCMLRKYQLLINQDNIGILHKLTFLDVYQHTGQLIDIYIDTDKDKYILYEVKHKDNIKEYLNELLDKNTVLEIKKNINELITYRKSAQNNIQQLLQQEKYRYIKYVHNNISATFMFSFPSSQKVYQLLRTDSFFLLYKDCSIETLTTIFDKLSYCGTDINWLINASAIIQDIKDISQKLNQKVYKPNFNRSNNFNFSTGEFGLKDYSVSYKRQLINTFNKIRACIECNDYPLQQIIIHDHAYIIKADEIIYNNQKYNIFMCRYFNILKTKVTDESNNQVSIRLKRKILSNIHYRQLLINIQDKYFKIDQALMNIINEFIKE